MMVYFKDMIVKGAAVPTVVWQKKSLVNIHATRSLYRRQERLFLVNPSVPKDIRIRQSEIQQVVVGLVQPSFAGFLVSTKNNMKIVSRQAWRFALVHLLPITSITHNFRGLDTHRFTCKLLNANGIVKEEQEAHGCQHPKEGAALPLGVEFRTATTLIPPFIQKSLLCVLLTRLMKRRNFLLKCGRPRKTKPKQTFEGDASRVGQDYCIPLKQDRVI